MTGAWIGVLGIILGTLLGGITTLYIARRKKQEDAITASKLIIGELMLASASLTGAVTAKTWWESSLPDEAWRNNRQDLIAELDENTKTDLQKAYNIVDSLNGSKAAGGDPNLVELQKNIAPLDTAKTSIETWQADQKKRQGQRQFRYRAFVLAPVILVVTFVATLAVIALVINRPNINQTTVSSALQSKLGQRAFVDCVPDNGNWLCTDHQLSAARGSCLTSQATSSIGRADVSRVVVVEAALVTSCRDTQETTKYIGEVVDGQIVGEPTAGEIARAILRGEEVPQMVVAPEPKSSEIERAWNSIFG